MTTRFDQERPIFVQLAEQLEDAILAGVYGEENQVPSITEYSVAYKINPATALKGVNLLVDAGLLYKKRGLGMFVAPGARDALIKRRREGFYTGRVLPVVREATNLDLTKSDLMTMIERGFEDGN